MLSQTAETNHFNITTQLCQLAKDTTLSESRIEIVVAATPSDIIDVLINSCTTPEEEDEYITKYLSLVENNLNENGYSGKYSLGMGAVPGSTSKERIQYIGMTLKYVIVKWSVQYKMPTIIDSYHIMQKWKNMLREQQAKQQSASS